MDLEDELYRSVTERLVDFVEKLDYPVHDTVAVDSFLEAFRSRDYIVKSNKDEAVISWEDLGQKIFSSNISHERILKGWNRAPRASPGSLLDSIYEVYDRFGFRSDHKDFDSEDAWLSMRSEESSKTMDFLKSNLFDHLYNYQENVFLSSNREMPELNDPELFYQVIQEFDLSLYSQSASKYAMGEVPKWSIPPSVIYENGFWTDVDFSEGIYPSKMDLEDYFVGLYLYNLAEQKGYESFFDDGNYVEDFMEEGVDSFKHGHTFWKKKSS